MASKFFVTTAIDYTNDVVHVGHSYQKILADALARHYRLNGSDTYFLTGTDEHGQKVEKSAKEKGVNPKTFADEISQKDREEWDSLNISYDRFIRTTDADHKKIAQEFFIKARESGDIYLSKYEGLYCEGCEAYYEEKDLIDGRCPFHKNKDVEKISEENYFFKLSKYQKFIEQHIVSHPGFIWPEAKRKEVLAFVKSGLKDFSVSRQNVRWGIPVPGDEKHTIYVWFDALINYYTYGKQVSAWPADVHVLGKDNQRFHAIYWPAMLKSVGLPLPKTILVHDFFSMGGQKISKSLGNVIRPSELVQKYGADAVRYYFLRYGPLVNDVDITIEKLEEVYNADLANGLGNLIARVARLAEIAEICENIAEGEIIKSVKKETESFRVDKALEIIWHEISKLDNAINESELWKNTSGKADVLKEIIHSIKSISLSLRPFLPATADKIIAQFSTEEIRSSKPLFPRLT